MLDTAEKWTVHEVDSYLEQSASCSDLSRFIMVPYELGRPGLVRHTHPRSSDGPLVRCARVDTSPMHAMVSNAVLLLSLNVHWITEQFSFQALLAGAAAEVLPLLDQFLCTISRPFLLASPRSVG